MLKRLQEIIEQVSEGISESWDLICEMSDPSSELKKKVQNKAENLVEHIYKVLVYSERYPDTVHHWLAEISANLGSYCNKRCKNNNKPLPTEVIVKLIKGKYVDYREMLDIVNACILQYGKAFVNYSAIYEQIMLIVPKLVHYIKSNEEVDLNELKNIIGGN